jgi:hypothetical protein
MNCWNQILSLTNNWESREVRVETYPSSSEKVVENIVLLPVSIKKARANNMDSELIIMFTKSHSS